MPEQHSTRYSTTKKWIPAMVFILYTLFVHPWIFAESIEAQFLEQRSTLFGLCIGILIIAEAAAVCTTLRVKANFLERHTWMTITAWTLHVGVNMLLYGQMVKAFTIEVASIAGIALLLLVSAKEIVILLLFLFERKVVPQKVWPTIVVTLFACIAYSALWQAGLSQANFTGDLWDVLSLIVLYGLFLLPTRFVEWVNVVESGKGKWQFIQTGVMSLISAIIAIV